MRVDKENIKQPQIDMMKRYFLKAMREKKIEFEKQSGNTNSLLIPNTFCEIVIKGDYVYVDGELFGDII